MAINIVENFLPILQQYEFAVVQYYKQHPELKDPQVIAAYEAAMHFFTRQKKGLPLLPVKYTGHTLGLFNVLTVVTYALTEDDAEASGEIKTTVNIAIICLKRLKESAERWHKKDGFRGYLNFIKSFVQ